ncbi:MAG: YbhB/YbcL family Raf kinase inhibitor-like protein [Cyanobacteria bacterium P01_E01_bin.35]
MRRFLIAAIGFGCVNVSALPLLASPFTLQSEQVENGSTLPESLVLNGFGCTGENISPQLSWQNPPTGTKSYVITVFDPDAPTGVGWWHWTVFNLPPNVTSLPANITSKGEKLPDGSGQGFTDFGDVGYGGACPPVGDKPHEYVFTVYALNVENIPADETTTGAKLAFLIKDHIIAEATIVAEYQR